MATSRKRNLEIDVVVDDKRAKAALKGVADETGKTGKAFSKMAGVLAGAFAATKIVDFAKDSIGAFSDLNESMNAVEVTFGDASDEVKQLGKDAATSVGLSNAEFNTLAVQMSAFAQTIAGDSGDVAGTIDILTTRVADFASVMNLDVAEAARLFQSGLAGETEPLRKFGLDLSAAAVTANAVAKGIGDSSGKLTEQEKVLSRYDLLMDSTNKTAGDFVNTSDELANKMRIVAAETENAKAQIGEAFAPVMEAAVPIIGAAAESAGILATMFLQATDQISKTEGQIRIFETATGETADTGAALLTLVKDLDGDMAELVRTLPLGTDELQKLRDADDEFLKSLGFTQDEINELNRLLEGELVAAAQSARDRGIHSVKKATDELAGAAGDAAGELDNLASELLEMVDPAFKAARAQDAARDAHATMTAAVAEFGPKSLEARQAIADYAQKALEAKAAQDQLAENGPTLEALEEIAGELGLTSDQAAILDSWLRGLSNVPLFTAKQIENIRKTKEEIEKFNAVRSSGGGGGSGGSARPVDERASGGPVRSGETYLVGEKGPELLHMGSSGHVTPNDKLMADGGGGLTVVIQGFVGSPAQIAQELDRLLTNRKRQSGLSFL
jgi:hypothetical protein